VAVKRKRKAAGLARKRAGLARKRAAAHRRRAAGARQSAPTTQRAATPSRPAGGRRDVGTERHTQSATAVAAEALRTGVVPNAAPAAHGNHHLSEEDRKVLFGDPDDDSLLNEYVGEDTPGGSTPTPDQSDVDEIGLAYGVKEEDSGELRTSSEVLGGRDRRRRGLVPRRRSS
jgi:hypothetical protein